jgi:hypothetical protein
MKTSVPSVPKRTWYVDTYPDLYVPIPKVGT